MYLIEHRVGESDRDIFPVAVDLEPIDRLKLHEETIASAAEKLRRDLTATGVLDHPVVIERGSGVVLDGMHRTLALKALGLSYVPVQLIDVDQTEEFYRRGLIAEPILQSWYWGIRSCGKSIAADDLVQAGLTVSKRLNLNRVIESGADLKSDMDVLSEALVGFEAAVGFLGGDSDELVFLDDSLGHTPLGDRLRRLSGWLADQGFPIDYRTRRFTIQAMRRDNLQALIIPPHVTMTEVRRAADGPLLPPKSTCFVLPARALHVCLPLDLLRDGDPDALDSFLAGKELFRIKGPAEIGRTYCEPWLYLFDRPDFDLPDALMESCPPGRIA